MYASTEKLIHVANVLEKCAAYFEDEETRETEKKAEALRTDYINPIKDSVENFDPKLQEKLANTDPEILSLLKNLSTTQKVADDGTLGGPTEKVASESDDDALLAFCLNED